MFQISLKSFLFFSLELISLADCDPIHPDLQQGKNTSPDMSLVEFQSILYSEINNEIEILQQQDPLRESLLGNHDLRLRGRYLREDDVLAKPQDMWDEVVQHGWNMSRASYKFYQKQHDRDLKEKTNEHLMVSPFLVCSRSSQEKSGYQRLQAMLELTRAYLGDHIVVRNDSDKTCYHVSLEYEAAQKARESMGLITDSTDDGNDYFSLVPLTDLMKIQFDTMTMISQDSWTVPSKGASDDWERVLRVGLSTGHRMGLNKDKVLDIASSIIDNIQSLGQAGVQRRQRLLQGSKQYKDDFSVSLSDVFSLTVLDKKTIGQGTQYLRKYDRKASIDDGNSHWNQAIELGLEADHSCDVMFKLLHVNVHYDNRGFDIVLNHNHKGITEEGLNENNKLSNKKEHNDEEADLDTQCENGVKCSSASNKHCVASLIMGLSVHPQVLSIESEGAIIANDYEAQWITQSKVEGKRPLREIGIDGTNQIISIIDSGLDINHKYFGPTDDKIFEVSVGS